MNNYNDALKKLFNLELFGINLGLEQTKDLFNKISNPHLGQRFIHVAGTNGKGSVCAILSKTLTEAGFKVGFFSSPHLISIRERFRINGKCISEEELKELINQVLETQGNTNRSSITFFEATAAIAALYFKNHECDFVIWETGMGGRLDSTNIVSPILSVITGISKDHEKFLGNDISNIAYEKAGIIKKNKPVFVGNLQDSAQKVIEETAVKREAPVYYYAKKSLKFINYNNKKHSGCYFTVNDPEFNLNQNIYFFPLSGYAQKNNLKLAYSILKYLSGKYIFDLNKALKGIKNLNWPGRIHALSEDLIIDGGHNSQSIENLIDVIYENYNREKYSIVFGCLKEKEAENILSMLSTVAKEFIFLSVNTSKEARKKEELIEALNKLNDSVPSKIVNSLDEAINTAETEKILITGSLYLAGEALKKYLPEEEIINI